MNTPFKSLKAVSALLGVLAIATPALLAAEEGKPASKPSPSTRPAELLKPVDEKKPADEKKLPPLPTSHTTKQIEGWTVRVDDRLLAGDDAPLGERAVKLLTARLVGIVAVMPETPLAKLREVPIQLDLTHGALKPMQYHPSAGWLKSNGYSPQLAKCVHIPDVRGFLSPFENHRQPSAVLHELAHAYHDRVLGFNEERVVAAWKQFRDSGKYKSVLTSPGSKREHYGLTNQMEFFAEMTESYLGVNDFYPFVAGELKEAEPGIFKLMAEIWGGVAGEEVMNSSRGTRIVVSTALGFAATSLIAADGFAASPATSPTTRPADSALATLAASMKPGEWRTLDTVGLTDSLRKAPQPSKGLDIMGWTDDAAWDGAGGQFVYMGLRQRRRLIVYSAADNRWRDVPIEGVAGAPPIDSQYGHIYGQNALDAARRRFYHAYHAQGDRPGGVSRLDLATGQWTALPMNDGKPAGDAKPVGITMTGCIEYFAARDGLVMLGEKGLGFFSEERQTWENLGPPGSVGVCGNHSLARHNPVRREVLMMGGNTSRRAVARLNTDGKIERLKDAPVDLGVRHDKLAVDPISGTYLVLVGVDRRLYEFDSAADDWRLVDDFTKTGWPFGRYDMPVVTPVPEHGVTMWVASRVWLYRHSPADGKPPAAKESPGKATASDGANPPR